jgi:hypothetical protein
MSPIHIGAGAIIGGIAIGYFVVAALYTPPGAHRLTVKNDFADATCTMEFADGVRDKLSVRKGASRTKIYKGKHPGFVIMNCQALGRSIVIPGSLYMRSDAVALITLKDYGIAEHTFVFDAAKPRPAP